ncbi:MAG: hypothetical protein RQ745_10235 [Longimicrobiales bacterium]|nr:hypothetical protein [Longimicrobiales bacterium]
MTLTALTALTLAVPLSAQQGRAQGGRGQEERTESVPWWMPRGPDFAGNTDGKRGKGPPFCRNGRGHPVHGMEWCADKGWARVEWDDVVFRESARSRSEPLLRRPTLSDILGEVILGRLTGEASNRGLDGEIEGQWVGQDDGPSILQLRVGDSPLAELTDMDRDNRADVVLLIDPE